MKVAIYARVSLDEKDRESRQFQDPENQLVQLRDFCKAMQYDIIEEYVDKMSGANPARPAFRKMLNDALLRRFQGIIVWKLDRFSREGVIPTLAYIKKLKDRGAWVKSITESWLDTSQEGVTEIVLALLSWVASEERKKISERTKAGIARRRSLGKWNGGRPKKTIKEEDYEKIKEMVKNGKSVLYISRKIKVSKDTINAFLSKETTPSLQ